MSNKYDSYKESGVEWIGEIPSHWDITRIKYKFQIGRGRVISNEDLVEDAIYPVYSSQTLNNGCLGYIETFDFDDKLITWTTDGANAGTVFLREGKFNCTNVCGTLKGKSDDVIPEFDYYFLQYATQFYKRPDTNGAKIMNNEMAVILSLKLSTEEQTAIAKYLDHKTTQIDNLIAKKEQFIQLLEEERVAVINQAVTKGLDPNVPMKDSGIEWLGEIPEHWDNPRMKHVCDFILDGTHGSFNRVENGFRLLSVRNIINNEFVFRDDDSRVSEEDFEIISKKFLIQKDDIQLAIVGATIGKVAIVDDLIEKIVTQRSLATIRVNNKICNPYYLYYFIISQKFQTYIWLNAGFSAQPGVYLGTLQNCTIPLPDLKTQNQIINFISEKSKEFDLIISKTKQEIELLKEYKTALISEVVTGKVDVSTSSTQVLGTKN